jgi:hypothetical protein
MENVLSEELFARSGEAAETAEPGPAVLPRVGAK